MIKCPYCGESYYRENYSTYTAVYYPPVWKNGVNINPDRNTTAIHCTCINCGKDFAYSNKDVENDESTLFTIGS